MKSLPALELHMFKVNNNQSAAPGTLPNIDVGARLPHNGKLSFESKGHLPTIPEAEHTPHNRPKAYHFSGLDTVPLLPTVRSSSKQNEAEAGVPWTEHEDAPGSGSDDLHPKLPSSSRSVPHYATPQDRTPLWTERGRPHRFPTPANPYKQNLDLASKVKRGANRFGSPAPYGKASEHLPAVLPLKSRWLSNPRQRAMHELKACLLTPVTPSDLAPAGYLKQGQLLVSVDNKLEALGLPCGTASLPVSRSQQWLAAHRLSPSLPADAKYVQVPQAHSPSSVASALSEAGNDSIATAISITPKVTAASPRLSDEASNPVDMWFGRHHSNASAAAGIQHVSQQSAACSACSALQPVQRSGSASLDGQTPDASKAEHKPVISFSQPLNSESQTLIAEHDEIAPQPQTLSAQPQLFSPGHNNNAAMRADGFESMAHSPCNIDSPPRQQACVPAAAEATVTLVVQSPSHLDPAESDKAKLGNLLKPASKFQPASGSSTVQQGMDVDASTGAAPACKVDGVPGCSGSSSLEDSCHASTVVPGSQLLMHPSNTSQSVSHLLEPTGHAVNTGAALAVMQEDSVPAVLPHTNYMSALDALCSEAGGEVGVEEQMEGGEEGDEGADGDAGIWESVARFQSRVVRVASQCQEEQAPSKEGADFEHRTTGCDLEQHLTDSPDILTGGTINTAMPDVCQGGEAPSLDPPSSSSTSVQAVSKEAVSAAVQPASCLHELEDPLASQPVPAAALNAVTFSSSHEQGAQQAQHVLSPHLLESSTAEDDSLSDPGALQASGLRQCSSDEQQELSSQLPAEFPPQPSPQPLAQVSTQLPVAIQVAQLPAPLPAQLSAKLQPQHSPLPSQLPPRIQAAQLTVGLPAHLPRQLSAEQAAQVSAQMPPQLSAQTLAEVPAQLPSQLSAQQPAQVCAQLPAQLLAQLLVEVPGQELAQLHSQMPAVQLPPQLPAPLPGTLSHVEPQQANPNTRLQLSKPADGSAHAEVLGDVSTDTSALPAADTKGLEDQLAAAEAKEAVTAAEPLPSIDSDTECIAASAADSIGTSDEVAAVASTTCQAEPAAEPATTLDASPTALAQDCEAIAVLELPEEAETNLLCREASGVWRDVNGSVSSLGSDKSLSPVEDNSSADLEGFDTDQSLHTEPSHLSSSSLGQAVVLSFGSDAWQADKQHSTASDLASPAVLSESPAASLEKDVHASMLQSPRQQGADVEQLKAAPLQGAQAGLYGRDTLQGDGVGLLADAPSQSVTGQEAVLSAPSQGLFQDALMQQGMAAASARLLVMGSQWGSNLGSLCNLGLILSPSGFILLTSKYEIVDIIGEGAYGLVMKCRVVGTQSVVAIKEFKIEDYDADADVLRACSLREVQILRELHHPNVVTYLEDFMLGNKLFIVCEYMPYSLLQLLEGTADPPDPSSRPPLPSEPEDAAQSESTSQPHPQNIVTEESTPLQTAPGAPSGVSPQGLPRYRVHHIIRQLLSALAYIHSKGIIYRDVKPENVLLDNLGCLKLCDFGFSRHAVAGDALTDYVATRWYRAPELLLGAPHLQADSKAAGPAYGSAVDVWAAGCVMAELLTGEALFPSSSDLDQLHLQLQLLGPLPAHMTRSFASNPHNAQAAPLPPKSTTSLKLWLGGVVKQPELQLLMGMLRLDPRKRWTAQRCLQHCLKHFAAAAP